MGARECQVKIFVPIGAHQEEAMTKTFLAKEALRTSVLCLVFTPSIVRAQHSSTEWGYEGKEGPTNWGKLDSTYAACSKGRFQSPIDIEHAKKSDLLPALRFDYRAVPLNVINNGHSIQVNYAPGSTLTVGNKTYVLKQFHFHHPSEEHVKQHGYDMSVHLVHADQTGHLAVVAVLLKRGDANAMIDSVWKNIPAEKEKQVDVQGTTVNAADLIPADHGYYTFAGSLTTPPCSEGVTWYVLKNAMTISDAEFAKFAKLYPDDARPIQPAHHRAILETK
jgi:carbonic anhydrase